MNIWNNIKGIKGRVTKWHQRRKYHPLVSKSSYCLTKPSDRSPFEFLKNHDQIRKYIYLYSYNQNIEREPLPRIALLFDNNARMLHIQRLKTDLYMFLDVKNSTEDKICYKGWYQECSRVKLTFNFRKEKLKMSIKINNKWQVIDEYYFQWQDDDE